MVNFRNATTYSEHIRQSRNRVEIEAVSSDISTGIVNSTNPTVLNSITLPSSGTAGSLGYSIPTGELTINNSQTLRTVPVNSRNPYKIIIYYGYPSLLNGIPTLKGVAQAFSEWDIIVLGDGLEHPSHPDHANTRTIIEEIHALSPTSLVAGYIDLGVSTQNLSESQLQQYTVEWKDIGADLIFWDDAGFDFNTTRERQTFAIQTARANGLNSFMNSFNTDDIFSGTSLMGVNDWFLLESLPFNDNAGVYVSPGWEPRASVISRVQKAQGWRNIYGSRIASVSLVNYSAYTYDINQYFRYMIQAVGFTAGIDAYGDCESKFSAFGPGSNTVFKGAFDEEMGRFSKAIDIIPVTAGIGPSSFQRYDYQTIAYYDENVGPNWSVVCPRTVSLAPFGLVSGQPPAGQKGRIAFGSAGVYVYDDGAAWNNV